MSKPMKYPSRIPMSNEEYHKHEAVGSSSLRKIIQKSAAHYLWDINNPKAPTPAKKLGTAIHQAILEPLIFEKQAIVMPEFSGKGSVAAKESWLQDHHNKTVMKEEELGQINGILEGLKNHKTAQSYLCAGRAEESIFWIDAETKLPCKARFDFIKDNHIIIDVKSTTDASFAGFQKDLIDYDYDMQAAHYLEGATEVFGHVFDQYVIIAVEKTPPYGINCFLLTDETIQEGRSKNQRALKILKKCRETGIYPGYPDETKPIWLPSWAIKGDE